MRILGIDPGSQCTGYGLIEDVRGTLLFLDAGEFRPRRSLPLPDRLKYLHDELASILDRHGPDVAAMEECFFGRHARAALVLGHARGCLMMGMLSRDIPIYEYAPRLVKLSVTGAGGAHKEQIQAMVPRLIQSTPPGLGPDASDALAVAVCHAHRATLPAMEKAPRGCSSAVGPVSTRSPRRPPAGPHAGPPAGPHAGRHARPPAEPPARPPAGSPQWPAPQSPLRPPGCVVRPVSESGGESSP